jgi:hypothetical protein
MAEAYRNAYLRQGVQDGEAFVEAWKFASDAIYASPYFTGDQVFLLSEFPEESARASTRRPRRPFPYGAGIRAGHQTPCGRGEEARVHCRQPGAAGPSWWRPTSSSESAHSRK